MKSLFETGQIVAGFAPIDLAGQANDGDYVCMANYNRLTILFVAAAGGSGEDPILALQQAKTVAGGSAKDLTFSEVWTKQGADLAAVGQFTKVEQTAAANYTSATGGETQQIWGVEITADMLDVDNGFDCVMAGVADTGSTAKIGTLIYILSEPRFAGSAPPSAIA